MLLCKFDKARECCMLQFPRQPRCVHPYACWCVHPWCVHIYACYIFLATLGVYILHEGCVHEGCVHPTRGVLHPYACYIFLATLGAYIPHEGCRTSRRGVTASKRHTHTQYCSNVWKAWMVIQFCRDVSYGVHVIRRVVFIADFIVLTFVKVCLKRPCSSIAFAL
jgi:hypothetical protein